MRYTKWLLLSALAFLLLVVLYDAVLWKYHYTYKADNCAQNFQKTILEKEQLIQDYLQISNSLDLDSKEINDHSQKLSNEGIYYFLYQNDSLKFWNSNHIIPPYFVDEFYRPTYLNYQNGAYIIYTTQLNKRKTVVILELENDYRSNSKYLYRYSNLNPYLSDFYKVVPSSEGDLKVLLSSGQIICALKNSPLTKPKNSIANYYIGILLFIIVLSFFVAKPFRISIGIAMFILWLSHQPETLFTSALFSSTIYSTKYLFYSVGELVLFILIIVLFTYKQKSKYLKHINIIALLATFFIVEDIGINSNIPINIYNIYNINIYTLIFILMIIVLANFAYRTPSKKINKNLLIFNFIVLLFSTILVFLKYVEIEVIAFIIIHSIFVGSNYISIKTNKFWNRTFYFVCFSIVASFMLLKEHKQRQVRQSPILANKILTEKDQIAEFLLAETDNKIVSDNYIISYFNNPLVPKGIIIERINQLYLKGYLSKFESSINLISYKGKPVSSIQKKELEKLKNKLKTGAKAISSNFYTSINPQGNSEFFSLYYFTNNANDTLGALSIELIEKAIYAESIYPELLVDEPELPNNQVKSYAIYFDNKLVSNWGNANYPIISNTYFNNILSTYQNVVHHPTDNTTIVLSFEKQGTFEKIATWGILLIICLIVGFIDDLIDLNKKQKIYKLNKQLNQIAYGKQIQYAFIATVIISFVFIALVTARYTQDRYSQNVYNTVNERLERIIEELNSTFTNTELKYISKEKLAQTIKDLSRVYQTDIDIYNKEGKLLSSSQELLYDKGILAPIINGNFLYQLNKNFNTKLIATEKIGSLTYLSGYGAIYSDSKLKAYVHLPYFSKEKDLNRELSNFFVTLFNIYLFLLLLLGFISYFISKLLTHPLSVISKQIANTHLEGSNKISWNTNDEIGELVDAYNIKVDKLNESAVKLAETEKEEAWREMAKQVAHEIKNPLTPMKLNVQQLQRAWLDKHPKLEQMFEKVTHILISQIDSLSRIASEFSTFAQMPSLNKEVITISNIFDEIKSLYEPDKNIQLIIDDKSNKSLINGDKEQLFRVFNNIVKNGIQSVEKGIAIINIDIYIENNLLHIEIKDNGKGIPESIKNKVFTPNFSTKTSGMGLGLAIVKTILEQHQASIEFKSSTNGTTFYIEIPLIES